MIVLWCLEFYNLVMRYIPYFMEQVARCNSMIQIHPTFMVVIRCIWNNKSTENKSLEDIQVKTRKAFVLEDCSHLKELHKVLLNLKHNLRVLPETRRLNPFVMNSATDSAREISNRSLYSNVTRKQVAELGINKEENFEKLRENLQKAILMVEEQLDNKENKVGDRKTDYSDRGSPIKEDEAVDNVCYLKNRRESKSVTTRPEASQTDKRQLSKLPNSNPTVFLFEKQMDVKSLVTDDADKHKVTEACKECSHMKEALLFLKRQLDNKPFRSNILADCNNGDALKKDSKLNETNYLVLNMPASAQKRCHCNTLVANNKQRTTNTEQEILNINAKKNILSIEILFNRNIQLDEITKEN